MLLPGIPQIWKNTTTTMTAMNRSSCSTHAARSRPSLFPPSLSLFLSSCLSDRRNQSRGSQSGRRRRDERVQLENLDHEKSVDRFSGSTMGKRTRDRRTNEMSLNDQQSRSTDRVTIVGQSRGRYRVIQQVSDQSWVDWDFGCSTAWLILMRVGQNGQRCRT